MPLRCTTKATSLVMSCDWSGTRYIIRSNLRSRNPRADQPSPPRSMHTVRCLQASGCCRSASSICNDDNPSQPHEVFKALSNATRTSKAEARWRLRLFHPLASVRSIQAAKRFLHSMRAVSASASLPSSYANRRSLRKSGTTWMERKMSTGGGGGEGAQNLVFEQNGGSKKGALQELFFLNSGLLSPLDSRRVRFS